tara:strand:- start:2122 stop:3291 length:1170 start_codon:yes stop_codon:yes gene_type:complete
LDEEDKKSLTLRSGSELAVSKPKGSRIVSQMTQDVLARTHSREAPQARFKLGDYEFREPDYRQILRWSEQLEMHPEALLEVLQNSVNYAEKKKDRFTVEDGAITTLVWSLRRLAHYPPSTWEPGLVIKELYILGIPGHWPDTEPSLRPVLPCLRVLELPGEFEGGQSYGPLRTLDLSLVPGLTGLNCKGNQLTELDLSPVPGLTDLNCSENQLTELDLSPVPGLTDLNCSENQLTELDLSPVPGLTRLFLGGNRLTELDLSPVPELSELSCQRNQFTELDLSLVPGLSILYCNINKLTELDLSPVPGLTKLHCHVNQLTELDLSPVPGLTRLYCHKNQLTELDLSPVPDLNTLYCDNTVHIDNAPSELMRAKASKSWARFFRLNPARGS